MQIFILESRLKMNDLYKQTERLKNKLTRRNENGMCQCGIVIRAYLPNSQFGSIIKNISMILTLFT